MKLSKRLIQSIFLRPITIVVYDEYIGNLSNMGFGFLIPNGRDI
jgi:hypothetical protein